MPKHLLPPTSLRVSLHTKDVINRRIQKRTQENIEGFKNKSKEDIRRRIEELEREWDIEKALETNASILIVISALLGIAVGGVGWFIFIGIIAAFLLYHALVGWCPPIPVFRRMGIRTSAEIDEEKHQLKRLMNQ